MFIKKKKEATIMVSLFFFIGLPLEDCIPPQNWPLYLRWVIMPLFMGLFSHIGILFGILSTSQFWVTH